jgi:hypothetical protein
LKKAEQTGDGNVRYVNKKRICIIFITIVLIILGSSALTGYTISRYPSIIFDQTNEDNSNNQDNILQLWQQTKHDIIVDYFLNKNMYLPRELAREYAKYVVNHSNHYKLDPFLVAAIIGKESTVDFMARSKVAHGLMQINWGVHKNNILSAFGSKVKELRDIYSPSINISIGCWILAECMSKADNKYESALCKYYGTESKSYTNSILSDYSDMSSKFYQTIDKMIRSMSDSI